MVHILYYNLLNFYTLITVTSLIVMVEVYSLMVMFYAGK